LIFNAYLEDCPCDLRRSRARNRAADAIGRTTQKGLTPEWFEVEKRKNAVGTRCWLY
jgi:hypothetical protein